MSDVVYIQRDLTPEEIAERGQWVMEMEQQIIVEQTRVAARESALTKLKKLGLTVDEAKAVIGIE